jgi:hypothetical protein
MLFGSVLTVGFLKTGNPARAVTPSDWTTYQYTPGRSGFNSAETAINPNTASSLIHQWTISKGSIKQHRRHLASGLRRDHLQRCQDRGRA